MILRRTLAVAVVVALLACFGSAAFAWSQGDRFFAVQSDSMVPTLHSGDLVVVAPATSPAVFLVGDVITFHPTAGYTTTHRIAAIDATGITTKGDANATVDAGQLQPGQIVGRVSATLPFAGYVAVFLQQPFGLVALLLLIVALAVAWELIRKRGEAQDNADVNSTESIKDEGVSTEGAAADG